MSKFYGTVCGGAGLRISATGFKGRKRPHGWLLCAGMRSGANILIRGSNTMAKDKITQKDFVAAYTWAWGGTKKNAKEAYENADDEYKRLIVKTWKSQSILTFWED